MSVAPSVSHRIRRVCQAVGHLTSAGIIAREVLVIGTVVELPRI